MKADEINKNLPTFAFGVSESITGAIDISHVTMTWPSGVVRTFRDTSSLDHYQSRAQEAERIASNLAENLTRVKDALKALNENPLAAVNNYDAIVAEAEQSLARHSEWEIPF